MWSADKWEQYRLIDSADGEKLEYWGDYLLRRPDPQAVWSLKSDKKLWNKADAWYHRSKSGGGKWEYLNKKLPERWTVNYRNLTFNIKPMGFKHTGLFPEQAVNWDWFSELIKKADRPIRVLNLFAYTGGATVAALDAGADIIMLDNMSVEDMKEAVKLVSGKAETECSGNVTKENVERLVDIGVDYISSGALTHSSPILDLSLKNLHAI